MKKTLLITLALAMGLLAGRAQSTFTITGTGTGTLNGVGFTDKSFVWTLTYSTDNPYTGWGPQSPVYTVLSSELILDGTTLTVGVTGPYSASGMWFDWNDPGLLQWAPMSGKPGANILWGSNPTGWDGISSYSSTTFNTFSFTQFYNLPTSSGSLWMTDGTVTSIAITGVEPVPEPSTLALAALGGAALLCWRRKK